MSQFQIPGIKPQFEGIPHGPTTDTFLFPVTQPLTRRSYQVRSGLRAIAGLGRDPSSDTAIYRQEGQPRLDDLRLTRPQPPSAMVPIGGPLVIVETPYFTLPPIWPSIAWWATPTRAAPWTPLLGAPAGPTDTMVFPPVWQPGINPTRPTPRLIVRQISGPTPVVPLVPNLPNSAAPSVGRWWQTLTAFRSDLVRPPLDQPTAQATFLYPLSQPDRAAWYVPKPAILTAPPPQLEGPSAQATFIFGVSQPLSYSIQRPTITPWVPLLGPSAPQPQTSLFPQPQPVVTTPPRQMPAEHLGPPFLAALETLIIPFVEPTITRLPDPRQATTTSWTVDLVFPTVTRRWLDWRGGSRGTFHSGVPHPIGDKKKS